MTESLAIAALAAQGDGVTEGGVFVPGTLPGERVRATVTGHRAQLVEVTAPSPARRDPPCKHFEACGGCTLQHASDDLLAEWKRDLIARALAARGIEDVEIAPTLTSPPASRRRVTFSARRTKKGTLVGYHGAASDQIVAIEECPVARPEVLEAIPLIERLVAEGASRKGEMKFAVTTSPSGLDIAASGGKPLDGGLYGSLVAATATSRIARLTWDGEPILSRRPPAQHMGRALVVPPPGGFLQATEAGEAALVAATREAVGDAARIVDLFSGCGTFTLPLAEHAEVHAVEGDSDALAALEAGWRKAEGLKRVTHERRDLFRRPMLARELSDFDALVFDPPRQGARAQVEQIVLTGIPRIAAISCNPATFARDARMLIDAGWRLSKVTPIDQFRWSPHVELAARFVRE